MIAGYDMLFRAPRYWALSSIVQLEFANPVGRSIDTSQRRRDLLGRMFGL